jgi:D-alanine-D-alanine ligase
LAFDKLAGKKCFVKAGITTPKVIKFYSHEKTEKLEKKLQQLGDKFVVKPVRQGSTIGVSIVDDPKSAIAAAQECARKFGDCMIEEYIAGREITVGILQHQTLPIIEIRSRTGFYDYHAKYIDEQTEYLFDTVEDPELKAKIETSALSCFDALGCLHLARVDFILRSDGIPYALEVNTIPGLTAHSLVPKAAAKAGLSMSRLCVRIIDAALKNKSKIKMQKSK